MRQDWSPEIDCIWSSVSKECSSFSGMLALFSHFVSYPPGYSSLENHQIKQSALNTFLNSMGLKRSFLSWRRKRISNISQLLLFSKEQFTNKKHQTRKIRHKTLQIVMSGDATEKPNFYNDKESKPMRNGAKWSEFITGHRHIVHIVDVLYHKQNIFNFSKSLPYSSLWIHRPLNFIEIMSFSQHYQNFSKFTLAVWLALQSLTCFFFFFFVPWP